MPSKPEFIGKLHERKTRDMLLGVEEQEDTKRARENLKDKGANEVEIRRPEKAAEITSNYLENETDFEIVSAKEVGDARKGESNEDADLLVEGPNGEEKTYSLKVISGNLPNEWNPTLNSFCKFVIGKPVEDLFSEKQTKILRDQRKVAGRETSNSGNATEPVLEILEDHLEEAFNNREEEVRQNLVEQTNFESDKVICKISGKGNFKDLLTLSEAAKKFKRGEGEAKVEKTGQSTIKILCDGKPVITVSIYTQNQSGESKEGFRGAIRVHCQNNGRPSQKSVFDF